FSRSQLQSVALPPPLANPGPSTVMICADTSANLTDPNWGLQPLFGSDDPNGLYLTGATNLGKQTLQFVGWRGQATESADNTYGPHCLTWVGGTNSSSRDTLYIDGQPVRLYESQADMLCPGPSGCTIPGPPLPRVGHAYFGYTNQVQDVIYWAPPAYLTGKIFFAA